MGFKNNFVVGITAALAASIIAPVVIPVVKRAGRPLAKSLVRGGLLLYESSREAVARVGETMEDVIAEVRAEDLVENFAMSDDPRHSGTDSASGREAQGNGENRTGGTDAGYGNFAPPAKEGRVA